VLGAGAVVEQGAVLESAVLHEEARVSHDSTVDHSVIGARSVVRPDVMLTAYTLVGPDVTVPSGTRASSGRIPSQGE